MEILASLFQVTLLILLTRTILNLVFSFILNKRLKNSQDHAQATMSAKGTAEQNNQIPEETVVEMVKDSFSNESIRKNNAYIVYMDGKDYYFSSWDHREKFLANMDNAKKNEEDTPSNTP